MPPSLRARRGALAVLGLLIHFADGAPGAPADRPNEAQARLIALLEAPGTPSRPEDLPALLGSPDRRLRTLAARVAARRPHPSDVEEVGRLLIRATPSELRAVVEDAAAPLPDAWAGVCRRLFEDGGGARARFAVELAASLSPAAAEEVLLSFLAAPSSRLHLAGPVLTELGRICSERSIDALVTWRHSRDEAVAEAADEALAALQGRLLSAARVETALAVLRRARASDPNDLDLLLHESLVEGVFLGAAEPVVQRLDRRFRDLEAGEAGAAARDAAELALARAAVHWFAGESRRAAQVLDEALARVGRPAPHRRRAATTRTRILLVASIFEVHDRGPTPRARARVAAAERAASLEETVCRFDDALDGPFGPLSLLGHLRRRGHEETRVRWYALADEVLAATPVGVPLDVGDAPAIGTDEAAVASARIRSWMPCRRAWAEFEAGRLEVAASVARRVEVVLGNGEYWNNRLLAAECSLVLGHVLARAEDAEGAREAYRRAERAFAELGEEGLRYELESQRGYFVEGAPPQRPHHAERRAQALAGLGEVRLRLDRDEAGAAEAFRRAHEASPETLRVLLRLGAALAAGEDIERAARLLDGTPRRAGLLAELAELATALGRTDQARTLLEWHLRWNALSEARAEQERRWYAHLAPPDRDG